MPLFMNTRKKNEVRKIKIEKLKILMNCDDASDLLIPGNMEL